MKQQTAVEWLVNQVEDYLGDIPTDIIEQAKEMEKEKIIDAIIFSKREHYTLGECWPTQTVIDKAESYYKKTFKNK
jgi:hypothetical protein